MTSVHSVLSGGGQGLDDAAVGGDVVSYDLSYLLTQDAFRTAYEDSLSTAREIAKPMVTRTAAVSGKGGVVASSLFDGSWSSSFREPHDPERSLSNVLYESMASSSRNNHHAYGSTGDAGLDLDLEAHMKAIADDLSAVAARGGNEESKEVLSSLQQQQQRCRSAVLGSAALSSAFLGTTLAAKQRTAEAAAARSSNTVVALDASDWRSAIVHALQSEQQQQQLNESTTLLAGAADDFAESVLAVLDITSFNML